MIRRRIQLLCAFLLNCWWAFPLSRSIYRGPLKSVCVPGLNCDSCPAAVGACPLGAIQRLLAAVRPGMAAGGFQPGAYVLGILGVIGGLVGRMPCGWVCPFGLLQELVYNLPMPKRQLTGLWRYGKYVLLAVAVIGLPLLLVDEFGYGAPWFCKYICPAGTLEAGLPLMALKPELRQLVGVTFMIKLAVLILLLIWMTVTCRPFCRAICPLGAIFSLFNRISVLRLTHDPHRCTACKACETACPMGLQPWRDPNQTDCIRCLKCMQSCRFDAISLQFQGASDDRGKPLYPKKGIEQRIS